MRQVPAPAKLVGALLVMVCVVATPAGHWPALAGFAVLILGVLVAVRLPVRTVLARSLVEIPFLVFAALLPVVSGGERVQVLGLSLSATGLVGGATLAIKATLGLLVAIVVATTTEPRDLLAGLERLRLPAVLVAILSFMLRYGQVLVADLGRMRLARLARGGTGPAGGGLGAVAAGVGTVFVRSYERGERVNLAMQARGYTGRMPALHTTTHRPAMSPAHAVAWAAVPALAVAVAVVSLTVGR